MRERFYVRIDLFAKGLPVQAISIYAYLARCANKEGIAFPSVARISRDCKVCKTTVRNMTKELESKGLLVIEPQYIDTVGKKRRQTSNIYRLIKYNPAPSDGGDGCTTKEAPTPQAGEEMNNKISFMSRDLSVSLYEEELEELIGRLSLHSYTDEDFAKAIELAVRDMYYAEKIIVEGQTIDRKRIRERLSELDVYCIDYVYSKLRDHGEGLTNASRYITACLYNAPKDVKANVAAFAASL